MFMEETFRWYGPQDQVPLSYIRQAGATGVVSSLHHIPYGEVWTSEEIAGYKANIEKAGLTWSVVESLPVHEDIKTNRGNCQKYLDNYRKSLENLGKNGIQVITYNFMPVLDWVRTDLSYKLPDGSLALYYNHREFAAFELFILGRKGAEADYTEEEFASAKKYYDSLSSAEREALTRNIIDNFPGFKGVTLDAVRSMLAEYQQISREDLVGNLKQFLEAVVPTAEEFGCRMVIHPDDPPRSILGLPRICSTANDIQALLKMVDSPANGICFCTGSLSAGQNDVVELFKSCADRVGFLHLRSTQRDSEGNFYEANHLEGSVDMYSMVKAVIEEQLRRREAGRKDYRIPFRPDHGHVMMDDLLKPPCANPGYTAIGRMRGMAEIRGLELGIIRALYPEALTM